MKRKYTHIKQYMEEFERRKQEGKSYREIGLEYGFSKEQVKECMRRPRRQAQKEEKRVPKQRGRPSQADPATWSALQKENGRLRMENELLRDFLNAVGRK